MKKHHPILSQLLFLLLIGLLFFIPTQTSFGQQSFREQELTKILSLADNPYKSPNYREVCDAFLFAQNGNYTEAKEIIAKIDKDKDVKKRFFSVNDKFDQKKEYEVYRALYNLTKGLIAQNEQKTKEAQTYIRTAVTEYNKIKPYNFKKRQMNSFGFNSTLNESLALLNTEEKKEPIPVVSPPKKPKNNNKHITKNEGGEDEDKKPSYKDRLADSSKEPSDTLTTPLPPTLPPPLKPEQPLDPINAELQAVEDAIDKINDKLEHVEKELREAAARKHLLKSLDNIDVTNVHQGIAFTDMRISFDYVEEGFTGQAPIDGLSITSAQLDATIEVIAKTLNEFVGPAYQAPADSVKAEVVGRTDNQPFETMAIVDKGNFYVVPIDEDIFVDFKSKERGGWERIRKDGLIMHHEQLAAVRAELAKQKLVQETNVLQDFDVETEYFTNQETGQVEIVVTVKDAFEIILNDLQTAAQKKLFEKKGELALACKKCDNCVSECTKL